MAKTRTRAEVRELKFNIKDNVGNALRAAIAKGKASEAAGTTTQLTEASKGASQAPNQTEGGQESVARPEGELDGET